MKTDIKKVDSQGRITLPYEWRKRELKDTNEVIIIEDEESNSLKIIPKKKIDLTQFFDSIEIDDDLIDKLEDWTEFEDAILKKKLNDF
ncbi:MAG: AbrB/MazE/SpoVT family DNA-binding domain-containing protein [Promethearchaeota archaeon]